jgi:hypothetical protein
VTASPKKVADQIVKMFYIARLEATPRPTDTINCKITLNLALIDSDPGSDSCSGSDSGSDTGSGADSDSNLLWFWLWL